MKQYRIKAYFKKDLMLVPEIKLVAQDFNSTELIFEFDIEEGRKVFELKRQDGKKYVTDIIDNKVSLVNYNEEGNEASLIPISGTYEFEIVNYTEDSKLTLTKTGIIEVRSEVVSLEDEEVEKDTRLPILDQLIVETEKVKNGLEDVTKYAKEQGDYAKEQASNVIKANEEANKIVSGFETNVNKYTSDFNKNAESKENSYNENASAKLKEYNDNTEAKIKAYDENATNKTTEFNKNVEIKINEFNSNATSKTEEYNSNAEAKVNEFNTNVDELIQDVEDCYNNVLTNEVEGTSIHVEDSAKARVLVLENEGNLRQETTKGINLYNIKDIKSILNIENIDENGWITVSQDNSQGTQPIWFEVKTNVNKLVEVGKAYALIVEIKEVSGTGSAYFCANQTASQVGGNSGGLLSSMTKGTKIFNIPMKSDFSNADNFLNTYGSFKAGEKGSITLRLSVLEDTTITPETFVYEKYTGGQASPNPDYPQEIEVVEAYNLFDKNDFNVIEAYIDNTGYIIYSATNKVLYIPCEKNQDYTISAIFLKGIAFTNEIPKTSISTNVFNVSDSKSQTKNSGDNSYLLVWYKNSTTSYTEQEILDSIQVVKGTEVKPYIPYGCIRNKFIGENLYNYKDTIGDVSAYSIDDDGWITASYDNSSGTSTKYLDYYTNNLNVKPSTNYAIVLEVKNISGTGRLTLTSLYYTTPVSGGQFEAFGQDFESLSSGGKYVYIVKTIDDFSKSNEGLRSYLNFGPGKSGSITFRLSVIEDTTVTPETFVYKPYKENTLDVNLQGNFIGKIGDVKDSLTVENGRAILTKRIGNVIFDGSESWYSYADKNTDNFYCYYTSTPDNCTDSQDVLKLLMCNYLTETTWDNIYGQRTDTAGITLRNNKRFYVRVPYATIDEFKNQLQSNPITVYYILAEPYEVDLGEVVMPKTFEGVTNISMIASIEGNMKLKYVRSTNIVVNNLAKAIVALGGEI